jgi:hypothetical protein
MTMFFGGARVINDECPAGKVESGTKENDRNN